MKWSFLANNEPRYLLCNADEGEPGTFKDRLMMERAPHQLIEGMMISAFAIDSKKSYISHPRRVRLSDRVVREASG